MASPAVNQQDPRAGSPVPDVDPPGRAVQSHRGRRAEHVRLAARPDGAGRSPKGESRARGAQPGRNPVEDESEAAGGAHRVAEAGRRPPAPLPRCRFFSHAIPLCDSSASGGTRWNGRCRTHARGPLSRLRRKHGEARGEARVAFAAEGSLRGRRAGLHRAGRGAARVPACAAQLGAGGARLGRSAQAGRALGALRRRAAPAATSDYDELLASGEIDAVYIALPNHLHREYAVRAARGRRPRAVREADGGDRGGVRGDDRRARERTASS